MCEKQVYRYDDEDDNQADDTDDDHDDNQADDADDDREDTADENDSDNQLKQSV